MMITSYHTRMRFEGEPGYLHVQLDASGAMRCRQWLPDCSDVRTFLKELQSREVGSEEFDVICEKAGDLLYR